MGNDMQVKPSTASFSPAANDSSVDAPRWFPIGTGEPVEGRAKVRENVRLTEDVKVSEAAEVDDGDEKVSAGFAAEVVGTADYDETLSAPMSHWGLKKMGLEAHDGLIGQQAA
jgi:hypothetical protein